MIEMSTEFHNKLGSSIIMIFVFSGTLCDYGKLKGQRRIDFEIMLFSIARNSQV